MKANQDKQTQGEQKTIEETSIKEEEKTIEEKENLPAQDESEQVEHICYDEFKNSLSTVEERLLNHLERSTLFPKLRSYFSINSPHITQANGVVPICINTIPLRYIGEKEFSIRTRNKGYEIQKGDVIIISEGAFGRAYARMSVFEKL